LHVIYLFVHGFHIFFFVFPMVKKKVVLPTLYVHQGAPIVHRDISTTADGRCLRNDTNLVNLPPAPISPPEHFIPLPEPAQNAPYVFDDDHIPINPENPVDLTGVNIQVTERSKCYQNLVSSLLIHIKWW
jgi:hypothetical protein